MPDIFGNTTFPVTIVAKVTPRAKKEYIRKQAQTDGSTLYRIYVHAAPDGGKANEAAIKLISKAFGIPRSCVTIVSGRANRNKIIRIEP